MPKKHFFAPLNRPLERNFFEYFSKKCVARNWHTFGVNLHLRRKSAYVIIFIVVKCTTNEERRFMKLTKEQTQEILKTINKVERLTEDFTITLKRARRAIEMNDPSAAELLLTAYEQKESSTLLCRALPIYSPNPLTREKVTKALTDATSARCGYTEGGWFCAIIPTLLPKKRKSSTDYIKEIMYASLERFFMNRPVQRFGKCTIVFRHVYDRNNPLRAWRDHDNIEIKTVIDAIALFIMEDDSPHVCQHFYCSAEGNCDKTEVYVVPQDEFILWHKMQSNIPDDGLKLYDSPHQKQV